MTDLRKAPEPVKAWVRLNPQHEIDNIYLSMADAARDMDHCKHLGYRAIPVTIVSGHDGMVIDRDALLTVVRHLDIKAGSTEDFMRAFDTLRAAFTPNEIAYGHGGEDE